MEVDRERLCRRFLREKECRAVAVWNNGPWIGSQDIPDERVVQLIRLEDGGYEDARDVRLQYIKEEERSPVRPATDSAHDLHMVQTLFLLMTDPRHNGSWYQRQPNTNHKADKYTTGRIFSVPLGFDQREWNRADLQLDIITPCRCFKNGLVKELWVKGHDILACEVHEGRDLELLCLVVCFVEVVGADSVWEDCFFLWTCYIVGSGVVQYLTELFEILSIG